MISLAVLLTCVLSVRLAKAGKRGLAWPWYNSGLDLSKLHMQMDNNPVVAIYDWETYRPPTTNGDAPSLQIIGMQRCMSCDSSPIGEIQARQSDQGWQTVFTLNEPDINGIAPGDAANWYKQYINGLNIKKALPAITSSNAGGQGLDWLSQMLGACNGGCAADYINLHWYGPDFSTFQAYVLDAHSRFPQYAIVITEFALQNPPGGQGDQVSFYQQAFSWLDGQDFVALYFPFVATTPGLLQQNDGAGAGYVGTGSCLYDDNGPQLSAVGKLLYS